MSSLTTTGCDQEDFGFLLDFLGFGGGAQPGLQTPIPGFQGSGLGSGSLTYQNPDGSLLGTGGSTSTIRSTSGFSPGGFPQVGVRGTQQAPFPSLGGTQTNGLFGSQPVAQGPTGFSGPSGFQPSFPRQQTFPSQPNSFGQQNLPTQFGSQPVRIAPTPQFTGQQPAPQTFVSNTPVLQGAQPDRDGFESVPTVIDSPSTVDQTAPGDAVGGLGQVPSAETNQLAPVQQALPRVEPAPRQGLQQALVPTPTVQEVAPVEQSPDRSNTLENLDLEQIEVPSNTGQGRTNLLNSVAVDGGGAAFRDADLNRSRTGGGGGGFEMHGLHPGIVTINS